jgi:hypothetical protein
METVILRSPPGTLKSCWMEISRTDVKRKECECYIVVVRHGCEICVMHILGSRC